MTLKRTADQAGFTDDDITYPVYTIHRAQEASEEESEESEESDVSSDEEEMPCCDDDFDDCCAPCEGQRCCGNLAGQRCPFGPRAATDLGLQMEDDWTCAMCATCLIKAPGGYCSKYRCPNYNQEGQCHKCRPSYAFH